MVSQPLVAEVGLDGWQINHQPPSSLTISSLEPEMSQKDPAAPRKHCIHCHQCLAKPGPSSLATSHSRLGLGQPQWKGRFADSMSYGLREAH